MRRLLPCLAVVPLLALASPASAAKVPEGPAGGAFYVAPKPWPAKAHGAPIWQRPAGKAARLGSASRTTLVLYRSTGVDGKPVAVSGTLFVPKGEAPKGGWPLISYAHGTTGIADQCAPSVDPDAPLTAYADPLLNRWLRRGWAVARTDYEGLGTPGVHPYLIGRSEGRSVLDMALAAHRLDPRVGTKRVVIAGHSQGGHAALWAGALAPTYAKALKVRGTDAYAPVSRLDEQIGFVRSLTDPGGGLSAEIALILRAIDEQRPDVGVRALLSDAARALYPQTLSRCLPALGTTGSFGGLAPAAMVRDDADLAGLATALDANDPSNLRIAHPVRVDQGEADGTVLKAFTDQLVQAYEDRGVDVDYRGYPDVDHGGVITQTAPQVASTRWIAQRLRR